MPFKSVNMRNFSDFDFRLQKSLMWINQNYFPIEIKEVRVLWELKSIYIIYDSHTLWEVFGKQTTTTTKKKDDGNTINLKLKCQNSIDMVFTY